MPISTSSPCTWTSRLSVKTFKSVCSIIYPPMCLCLSLFCMHSNLIYCRSNTGWSTISLSSGKCETKISLKCTNPELILLSYPRLDKGFFFLLKTKIMKRRAYILYPTLGKFFLLKSKGYWDFRNS